MSVYVEKIVFFNSLNLSVSGKNYKKKPKTPLTSRRSSKSDDKLALLCYFWIALTLISGNCRTNVEAGIVLLCCTFMYIQFYLEIS